MILSSARRTRQEIFAQYAQHLSASEREAVAAATESMSGRDIRDICEQAERHWASKVSETERNRNRNRNQRKRKVKERVSQSLELANRSAFAESGVTCV